MTRPRVAAACAGLALALVALARSGPSPPRFDDVRTGQRSAETLLLDRRGVELQTQRVVRIGMRLAWTPLGEISPALVRATLAAEDRRFASHPGVDPLALLGAVRDGLRGRRRGASTLAMQLVSLLGGEAGRPRGVLGKLSQMRAALALERAWSKDEVLEAYLNLASFRGELVGVEAAARGLLRTRPGGVDGAGAALLAALLRAPNAGADRVAARACRLAADVALGISCDEARAAAFDALSHPPDLRPEVALAPHLATRLLAGAGPRPAERIVSTLDARVQRLAREALARQLAALQGRGVRDGAVLVVENRSGDVLAYVGSSGARSASPLVDGVRARRQAGSTLKPFLYATALDERLLTASSRLDDAPLEIATERGVYAPENYDHLFRGPVSVRTALASSLNVPAVRTLELVGGDRFVERLGRFGFRALRSADDYGASVALGSADVTLEELVNAYRTLANGGGWSPLRLRLDDPVVAAQPAVSPEAAFVVADVLADRGSRSATFGLEGPLAARVFAAVKTGTSKDMRDNWCVGFTREHTVGVWVGNFGGEPMRDVSGVDGAAPAWLELVTRLAGEASADAPPAPAGVVRANGEWYLRGTEPSPGVEAPPAAPRIRAPADGTIVAIDPDVPASRQRLLLEARPAGPRVRWTVDGVPLAGAGPTQRWAPTRGRHVVELVDERARSLDRVGFEVR